MRDQVRAVWVSSRCRLRIERMCQFSAAPVLPCPGLSSSEVASARD